MLYITPENKVVLEVATEDGYRLIPNYDHSAYVCSDLLWFPELVFYNDYKQGHFNYKEGVHFTVTQTIRHNDYYQCRIPYEFEYTSFYTYEDGCYWSYDDKDSIDIVTMQALALEIEIKSWTCIPDFIEKYPIIPINCEWQEKWFANA